jgi:DNA-binding IclR family transcriptional regulator
MSRPALAATRAISVLNFLAAHPADEFTLSDLAVRLDINVASAHALLGVLADAGYVTRHSRLRTYTLGPSVVALGTAAMERHAAIDLARDAARDLAKEVGLEVAVTAPAGDDIVFLARAGEHQARGMAVHVGQRVPLVPPLGSVFMAWGGAEPWLARAEDPARMQAVLDGVRGRGYSIALEADARRGLSDALDDLADAPADAALRGSVDELVVELGHGDYQVQELDPGRTYDVSMVAAPVFGSAGEVVLALTLVGFAAGLPGDRVAAFGEQVRDVALVVTKRSLGRVPA